MQPLGPTTIKKPKIKLRHVSDDWRLVASRASSPSPLGHLARHLTLQTLALLATLTGTRAGVVSILDSLSPHCNLISTNALDLDQACDIVQRQFLGCLAAFVATCAAAHRDGSFECQDPVTLDQTLRILADARYDCRHNNYRPHSGGSTESSAWESVVEQGERIVSEWVRTPATANPHETVMEEEKKRRREMFDALAEQLSDLMTREYPRLWRYLNDQVDEITIQVSVPAPSTVASRKPSTAGHGHGYGGQLGLYSVSPSCTSPTVSDASSSGLPLSEKYSSFQPPRQQLTAPAPPTVADTDLRANSTPTPAPKPASPQPLTANQRQATLARIRAEYANTTTTSPAARRLPSSSSSSSSNPTPFRVHVDRHFPATAQTPVLATSQSQDSHAYQSYASTHVRRPPYVSHATPWIPPNFSCPSASPSSSSRTSKPSGPASASLKYGGSWTIPPHMRARAIRERALESETGVSMGYRLTPSGGERNAHVRGKVDELARRVAGVSVEMAAEARALHGGAGGNADAVSGKGKAKRGLG